MPKRNDIHSINLEEMLNDASIDRIFAIDTEWKIVTWNKTSENITGITKQEVLGKQLLDVFPQLEQDPDISQAFQLAIDGKKSFLPPKSGVFNRNSYENHFIPLADEDGNVIGVMNIMRDVTYRVKSELQLQKLNAELKEKYNQLKNANAEFSTFTAITGNELKDPIKKIYTSLEFVIKSEGKRLSDDSKAKFRRMQSSLNRINLLLDDILSISAVNSFSREFTIVNLHKIIEEVLVSLRKKIEEKQAIIEVDDLPDVYGSRQMLHYLFYNLLDNALKFQHAANNPRICITVCKKSRKSTDSENNEFEKDYTCISVVDNGIGFDQANAERIFQMFEQLHSKKEFHGSGIGLTVCRKIAEAHGGHIEAESIPGKGSSFHCYFPKPEFD